MPSSCGEKVWAVAYADPRSYSLRAVQGMWLDMGGKLGGSVRYGASACWAGCIGKPTLEVRSAPLAEIIRDINKYSNNVMAQQVFLTLSRVVAADASPGPGEHWITSHGAALGSAAAFRRIARWCCAGGRNACSTDEVPVVDNGSGLSRQRAHQRPTGLHACCRSAFRSPLMPELMSVAADHRCGRHPQTLHGPLAPPI
jgi:D-alanyl-D-alanine carboxypeptidase/D-alanyl-D-alanine-endopeptidase (penicillin-binding protein 4)